MRCLQLGVLVGCQMDTQAPVTALSRSCRSAAEQGAAAVYSTLVPLLASSHV